MVHYTVFGKFVELYFDEIPDDKTRDILKSCNWRWYSPKKCWSNFNTYENVTMAKSFCDMLAPKTMADNPLLNMRRNVFSQDTLIIRSNTLFCDKKHHLVDMAGEVEICDSLGVCFKCLFPIVYCAECDMYFLLEGTYKKLREKGVLLCQVMDYRTYKRYGAYSPASAYWREESPLKILGYSVSNESGLSIKQRREILRGTIGKGVLSKQRVLEYLDFFMKLNHTHTEAVERWQDDREYICNYEMEQCEKKKFGKMIIIS